MDFVVGLPIVKRNGIDFDSILTVTDYLSKFVILIPLPSTSTAPDAADQFLSHVYRRFGLPLSIVSDRDPKFTSAFWRALNSRLGIKLRMTTSAHPQTDGQAEPTNKLVGQTLRILCEDDSSSWLDVVPACEFGINSSPSSATSLSPFDILHGFSPAAIPRFVSGLGPDASFSDRARLNALRATDAIIATRVSMTFHANKRRTAEKESFQVGEKAYVSKGGMRFPGSSGKFIPKFIGPYSITASSPDISSYTLDLPRHLRVHRTFHTSKLRPIILTTIDSSLLALSTSLLKSMQLPTLLKRNGKSRSWWMYERDEGKGSLRLDGWGIQRRTMNGAPSRSFTLRIAKAKYNKPLQDFSLCGTTRTQQWEQELELSGFFKNVDDLFEDIKTNVGMAGLLSDTQHLVYLKSVDAGRLREPPSFAKEVASLQEFSLSQRGVMLKLLTDHEASSLLPAPQFLSPVLIS
ncbi:hypothetical protein JCM16303_004679 [Sporobolomyces ruberrimus]